MNSLGVPPEIAAPLSGGDGRAEMIVMMLVQGVESLGVGIADEVVEVLGLSEARMLGTRRCVMVRGKGRREVGRLKVRGGGQRGAPVMGHTAAVAVAPVAVVMGTGVRRTVAAAQGTDAAVARQTVLGKEREREIIVDDDFCS